MDTNSAPHGLGAVRQSCLLATSGFLFMSFLAAAGWHCGDRVPGRSVLEATDRAERDGLLAMSDHPPTAPPSSWSACVEIPGLQPEIASARSARTRSTSGCGSPTRSMMSASVSSRSPTASSFRPAATSMVAYSNFAAVAKR
jgi:hypothetical protein